MIEWKQIAMNEYYGFHCREMVMKIITAGGPLFYVLAVPAIQYTSESDLIRAVEGKHRAA